MRILAVLGQDGHFCHLWTSWNFDIFWPMWNFGRLQREAFLSVLCGYSFACFYRFCNFLASFSFVLPLEAYGQKGPGRMGPRPWAHDPKAVGPWAQDLRFMSPRPRAHEPKAPGPWVSRPKAHPEREVYGISLWLFLASQVGD